MSALKPQAQLTRRLPLALTALLLSTAAWAQTPPMTSATAADFERQLEAADGPVTKGFRPTAPPDPENRCAASTKEADGPGTKTLEVVYADDSAPQAQMALRFGLNSDVLTPDDRRMLDQLSLALNGPRLKSGRFAIAGHTDVTGDATATGFDNNRRLSCARALRVVDYLVDRGRVARDRLTAYGFGSKKLLTGFASDSPQHRRVEIRRAN